MVITAKQKSADAHTSVSPANDMQALSVEEFEDLFPGRSGSQSNTPSIFSNLDRV